MKQFYKIGEIFQDMAVNRSRKSILALMDIRPDFANLKVNGELKRVDPEEVRIGDIIVVKPGEKVPLDGKIIEGKVFDDHAEIDLDEKLLAIIDKVITRYPYLLNSVEE